MGNKPETEIARQAEFADAAVTIPRLLPESPLPDQSYVPGRTQRPADAPPAAPPSLDPWQRCRPYLLGIDLFNHGYYWEAHESWEAVWLAAGRRGARADFLKGLIKLTAALVKAREGRPLGVARHARRASELFQSVASEAGEPAVMMGLDLNALNREAQRIAQAADSLVDTRDLPVLRLTDYLMQPAP